MKRWTRALALAGFCSLLAACAGTPPAPQAPLPVPQPGAELALGRSKSLDNTNHISQHLDPARNIVYSQNFGGGGVGLGLLGPLGVAANISMIEANTKADADLLRGKLQLDPLAAFTDASREVGTVLSPGADRPVASPYVMVVKTTPETLAASATLLIEAPGDKPAWSRRYQYQLPGSFTLASLGSSDGARDAQLQRELTGAFKALLLQVRQESAGSIAQEAPVVAKSTFLTPRFEFDVQASLIRRDAGMVWLRMPFGVTALPEATVSVTPRK